MKEEKTKSKTVSYSQYSIYKQCQHRWSLDYAKGLRDNKPSIHTTFGTCLHETLQNYLQIMYDRSASIADKIHLPTYFKTRFIEHYKKESTTGHYSTPEELSEFYEDAVAILDFVKKKRSLFFKRKNTRLIGIEVPINRPIVEGYDFVRMVGFIDLIIYDKTVDKYTIYDIKTSTRGWTDYEKKDQVKVNQILLYKKFFSLMRNIPEEKIDVEFFIVRRKINEDLEYVPKRVQEFIPAHGPRKVKSAYEDMQAFVKDVFNLDGTYQQKDYPKNTNSCRFCPYFDKLDLCDRKNS